ncbi:HK97-gp10 family putative phage morphogenesis protein [Paraburkholderia phymatum]|uniref:Phage protein, HK97 gp10 family n=1 Tax=Paraburkholderia phymatum (strain DSM 17167 / CIP 108236 / LMG 21445 / STM815) TaxID=391038 RepID=B2JU96_PARP8|nr:HK97-gp10 family putative phage morphogenesis protein [Paraburkholderia phymatum]ACC76149.1 phage protein, HK97 gp10 family [Paraburkholderia phymatum STM815]
MASLKCIKGFEQFSAALEQFPQNVARNVMRTGLRKGAELLHETAKNLAPELEKEDKRSRNSAVPGRLKDSIYHKLIPELSSGDLLQTYFVGVRRGQKSAQLKVKGGKILNLNAYYWTWVEFGHYYVPPRNALQKSVYSKKRLNEAARLTGMAVWIPPRHFMRDAWTLSRDAVMDVTIRYMEDRIPIEAKKLGLDWKAK